MKAPGLAYAFRSSGNNGLPGWIVKCVSNVMSNIWVACNRPVMQRKTMRRFDRELIGIYAVVIGLCRRDRRQDGEIGEEISAPSVALAMK